jgi:hypothetical protein
MSAHEARIQTIVEGITAAQQSFSARFATISDDAAIVAAPDNGWSAAEVAMHVAITNEWVADVLSGHIQAAQPAPPNFREDWSSIVVAERLKTFPALEPPAGVTKRQASNRLAVADNHLLTAASQLDEGRAQQVVKFPFGTLSLYQVGEFAAIHANRHEAQLQRIEASTQLATVTASA